MTTPKTKKSRPSYKKAAHGITRMLFERAEFLRGTGTSMYVKEQDVLEDILNKVRKEYPEVEFWHSKAD